MFKMNASFPHLIVFYSYQPLENSKLIQLPWFLFVCSISFKGNLAGGDCLGSVGLEALCQC